MSRSCRILATMGPTKAPATIDYRLSTIDYEEELAMNRDKVCPLRVLASEAGVPGWGPVNDRRTACLGCLCAWYDAARECCVLVSIARCAV